MRRMSVLLLALALSPATRAQAPAEMNTEPWEGSVDRHDLGRVDFSGLPDSVLAGCLGLGRAPSAALIQDWRGKLFSPRATAPEIEHVTLPLPFKIAGAGEVRLWVIAGNYYCLVDKSPDGHWTLLSRLRDAHSLPVLDPFIANDPPEAEPEVVPEEYVWLPETRARKWRVLLVRNGGLTDGWLAETLEVTPDGRRMRRLGGRTSAFDAFVQLRHHRSPVGTPWFWDDGDLGDSHYCRLFSQSGGLEWPEHQQQIITEEIRLGRRISKTEALSLIGGDAKGCLPKTSDPMPNFCGWISERGLRWGDCKSRPNYAEIRAYFIRPPDPPPAQPERDIPPRLQAVLPGRLDDDLGPGFDAEKIEPGDLKGCLDGDPKPATGLLSVPFATVPAASPAMLVANHSLCLFATPGSANSTGEKTPSLLEKLILNPALPALRWVAWIPGSTVRYRYFILAGSESASAPVNDLRLYRLDLAEAKLQFLDRLSGPAGWFARDEFQRDRETRTIAITNFDPRVSVDPIKDCFVRLRCKPGDLRCGKDCAKLQAGEKMQIIIDNQKLVEKPWPDKK